MGSQMTIGIDLNCADKQFLLDEEERWTKKNDVAKMRQAGTAPATDATVHCPTGLWCAVTCKHCSDVDDANALL